MIESIDRLAVWNLVATVDAFLSSGFSPAELLQAVHPSDVGSTQGTGIGGTDSMRKLFVDGFLGEDRPSDILQEALPNVIAAHVMQSYVGGYGVMVHPVGACATAAVSIEDAVDKIDCGKADFVVAGAIDDISIESITGFGDMNATAKTQDLLDKGINERFVSRANDRRRGGFVESEGGGTVLITRGDIAYKLGLPVLGVIGYSRSFADGAHTSIPAPGLGALGAVRGGRNSKFVQQLASLGVEPDDITVVSKHDTSTDANDPNESELYVRLSAAIERTDGNPLFVISQKTVTGHAKGGAAVFQVNGLCQLFKSGRIPANRALDCVAPEFKGHSPILWVREPLDFGRSETIKAGLITSLGFGHVAGLIALVHPGSFEEAVVKTYGLDAAIAWRARASQRLRNGRESLELAILGKKDLFEPIDHRRFEEKRRGYDPHEVEVGLLLSPDSRLGPNGKYELF
jgi:fatty acid synthase